MENNTRTAAFFRVVRARKGKTMSEMEELLGVSSKTYRKYEKEGVSSFARATEILEKIKDDPDCIITIDFIVRISVKDLMFGDITL